MFTPFSSVSIINFEQVDVCRVLSSNDHNKSTQAEFDAVGLKFFFCSIEKEFVKLKFWLLLIFFICLHNQLKNNSFI